MFDALLFKNLLKGNRPPLFQSNISSWNFGYCWYYLFPITTPHRCAWFGWFSRIYFLLITTLPCTTLTGRVMENKLLIRLEQASKCHALILHKTELFGCSDPYPPFCPIITHLHCSLIAYRLIGVNLTNYIQHYLIGGWTYNKSVYCVLIIITHQLWASILQLNVFQFLRPKNTFIVLKA